MDRSDKKRMRSILACNGCRARKLKCINDEDLHKNCERCRMLSLPCEYSPRVSQLKRMSIEKIKNFDRGVPSNVEDIRHSESHYLITAESEFGVIHRNERGKSSWKSDSYPHNTSKEYGVLGYLKVFMPSKDVIIELADIFFRNQYQGIFPFIHKPSFLAFLRSKDFDPDKYMEDSNKNLEERPSKYASSLYAPDPVVILAILALCARLHPVVVEQYGHFKETEAPHLFRPRLSGSNHDWRGEKSKAASCASKYFAWHARNRLKDVFDSPTIQRVQALTMLSSHEWGEMNAGRSFSYIGLAARMALMMGMGSTEGVCYKDSDEMIKELSERSVHFKNEEHWASIILESKRRTLWSVYMMDRCISSGRNRSSAVEISDINIPVPCSEQSFTFGEPESTFTYQDLAQMLECFSSGSQGKVDEKVTHCSSYAFTILAFEIWAAISKWAGEIGFREERFEPWSPSSRSWIFCKKLDMIEEVLPTHLKFSEPNLNAHMAENTAGLYGYLHCLLFISRIFLHRENLYCRPDMQPEGWWQLSAEKLFKTIKASTTLLDTLSGANLMIIAPFTGFELFTNAGTCLYFNTFPDTFLEQYYPIDCSADTVSSSLGRLKKEVGELTNINVHLLENWANVWSLCKLWSNWVSQMRMMLKCLGSPISDDVIKKHSLRLALRDYGQNEIVEDNDYVNGDTDQFKKTRLLRDLLGREEALSIISLLNSNLNTKLPLSTECSMTDNFHLAKITDSDPTHTVSDKVAELLLLDSTGLNECIQDWYDVINIENSRDQHHEA